MTSAIWFLVGFIVSDIIGRVASLSRSYLIFKQAELDCLMLIGSAAEDYSYMKELNKQSLETALSSDRRNEIIIQANLAEHSFSTWKRAAIKNVVSNYPVRFKRTLKYHDWQTAMGYLTEQLKINYTKND